MSKSDVSKAGKRFIDEPLEIKIEGADLWQDPPTEMHAVRDTKTNEIIALFPRKSAAGAYAKGRNHIDEISCCALSKATNGWKHHGDCRNWVLKF